MSEGHGKYAKNIYVCSECGHHTITIDRDWGVTPYLIACRKCDAKTDGPVKWPTARSSLYRVSQSLVATHEWYRPDAEEIATLTDAEIAHVQRDGLLLRRIETMAEWIASRESNDARRQ